MNATLKKWLVVLGQNAVDELLAAAAPSFRPCLLLAGGQLTGKSTAATRSGAG